VQEQIDAQEDDEGPLRVEELVLQQVQEQEHVWQGRAYSTHTTKMETYHAGTIC
jgi:hypothetical protein